MRVGRDRRNAHFRAGDARKERRKALRRFVGGMGVPARGGDRHRSGMSAKTIDIVVTYLVLTAPPKMLPPMPVGARFALMKVEDIPLHYYRYLYGAVGTNWLRFERLALGDADLSPRIHK